MPFKSLVALFTLVGLLICSAVLAQDTDLETAPKEPTFKLLRDSAQPLDGDDGDEEEEIWVPGIHAGTIEFSFSLGSLGLNSTLLKHEQMIYKYNEEDTYWGDYEIKGQSAFQPVARLGYNVKPWLSIEAIGSFSFSDYTSSVDNIFYRSNDTSEEYRPGYPATLGEFDLEKRSLFTANAGVNAVIYFRNLDGNRGGRFHPFVTGGVSNMWYSMNSNFVDEAATAMDFNIGGGLRLLADRKVSVRLEAVFHFNSLEWTPAQYYTERDDDTVQVPLYEFPVVNEQTLQVPIESFESNSIGALAVSLGVQGSF